MFTAPDLRLCEGVLEDTSSSHGNPKHAVRRGKFRPKLRLLTQALVSGKHSKHSSCGDIRQDVSGAVCTGSSSLAEPMKA